MLQNWAATDTAGAAACLCACPESARAGMTAMPVGMQDVPSCTLDV